MAEVDNVKKFLDFLGRAEGADYDTIVGSTAKNPKKISDYSKHPRVVGLVTADGPSTAAGKYQITKTTYDDFAPKLGITDFSPASQDRIALAIIQKGGALEDVRAGRFDAAIQKLGGRWASLPSSPYQQSKRSPEWVARELNSPTAAPTPQLEGTIRDPAGMVPTQSPGQSQLLMADLKKSAENDGVLNTLGNLPSAVSSGFQNENNAYNWWVEQGAAKSDPNFKWDKDKVKAATDGLPEDYRGYILNAISDDDVARRRARMQEAVQRQEEMARMGPGVSFIGAAAGSLLDVDTAISLLPIVGEIGMANKASRLSNAIRAGLAAGAVNAGSEYAFGSNRPTGQDSDIYLAGLFGLGLGGAVGALRKPAGAVPDNEQLSRDLSRWAQKSAADLQRRELEDSGFPLTESGRQLYDSMGRSGFSEADLSNVGLTPNRSRANLPDVDSVDIPAVTYGDMKTLKSSPMVGENIEQARVAISKAFGADILDGLEASGRIKFLNSQDDLPEALRREGGVKAFYDPITDTTFLMADRINSKNARGIIMHDVGVHQGLERIVGTPMYNRMISEVDRLAAEGDVAAQKALARAEKSSTKDFIKAEEKLAYYMEAVGNKAQGFLREIIATIKTYLIKRFGFDIGLNEKDLVAIVQGSVKRVARDKEFGSYNNNFPYVWSGSPTKGIEKFSTDFVGTGEGNVNQGWGIYTTSSKFIGNWYREKESMLRGLNGEDGGLYQLKVLNASPQQFLRWDTASQSKEVLKALRAAGIDPGGKTGRELYFDLMAKTEGDTPLEKAKGVSQFLDSIGVKGNVYATGNTRNKKVQSDNFVLFNDKNLDITQRFSEGPDIDADLLPPKDANENVPEGFYQGPAYENFFNRPWVPNEVKSFVRSIFGSSAGYKDHSVVAPAAMDQKKALAGQWQNQFAKALQPAVQEFLTDMQVPLLKRSEALDGWNESLGDYIRGVPGDYHPTVTKVGDEWKRLSKEVVDHINNPGKFNGDVKKGLTQTEIIDEVTGQKSLSDPLEYNENYLPRIPDIYKMSSAIAQFGRETVEGFIGGMFKSANASISDEVASKLGKWYLRTIEDAKVNRAMDLVDNTLRGFDKVGFKDSLMKVGGLSFSEADRVIASLSRNSKSDDVGAFNSSLKRRSTLDETYTQQVVLKNGSRETLSYKDLFDTDTVGTITSYFTKQAGAISLANHTGLYNVQSVKKAIAEITSRDFGSDINAEQITKMRKHLEDIVDLSLGRPLEEFAAHNKALQMMADYNVLTKAGLFVLNQITELSQMLGSSMYRSVLKSVPELNNMIRDSKTGKVNNEVINALENLSGGPGTALLRDNPLSPNRTWVREKGDTAFNRWLDRTDNVLKRGTSNLFKFTGMTGVQIMQQRTFAVAMVNHFVDHAVKGKTLGISPERLAWMGLDATDTSAVMNGIKTYHKDGKGRLGEVDFNKWSEEDPKTFSKFVVAYQRETARVIQENDLASMVPIMGKQVGQTVFQFMGFPLQAWNKSLLFAVNHRDIQTLNTVMYAVGFNTLMYIARTNMQMINLSAEERKEFADKRLNPNQVTLNAIGRIPQLSVLPNIFDTVSPVPLFSGMRTTTDLTDFVSGNPTLSTLSGALNATKKMTRNAGSEEYQTTEKDMKKMFQLLPLNNVMGINQILSSVSADFPSNEKVED